MKVSALFTAVLAATGASAAPAPGPKPCSSPFGIMTLRSASPLHFGQVSAARSNLFIHLPDQHAQCRGGDRPTGATLYIKDQELFLLTPPGKPVQKIYVDRSGMGQGYLGYTTGQETLPRYAETRGWQVGENNILNFNGTGLIACPNSMDGAWSIWAFIGIDRPAGQEGCLGFSPMIIPDTEALKCQYTQRQ
ncbi:hypothetical protein S7711_07038 [Stachybotrys chartarum IBT 7711]|uniref:Cell wall protein PhiA n=1 Tax=Stachybotrys chartarum (strain CBS 109288 / IBT 7711) TaxID=1280523 RepID=A0A084ASK7_STACB|nr:hypothetical protein S7711_07038 [Stachybotrys chartarum IBT 7711]KFA80637.1 hypothetical protein S40288_07534 [Stachybotrys chartarum IBT 40288]